MVSASLHFVIGPTGAGKTTYALRLCREIGAIRFSVDEWMSSLLWMDSPDRIEADWVRERVRRCSEKIWETAVGVAALGVPCVLEADFASRASRFNYTRLANEAGLSVQLHLLDVPVEERWERVRKRNAESNEVRQLKFEITREMFDFTERLWSLPQIKRCQITTACG
jgi:predicted kinase